MKQNEEISEYWYSKIKIQLLIKTKRNINKENAVHWISQAFEK